MRHRRDTWLLVAFLTTFLALAGGGRFAAACDIDVREAGFVTGQGMPYMLREYMIYFLDRKTTPEQKAHAERMQKLFYGEMSVTNLIVEATSLDELGEENIKELKSDGVDLDTLPITLLIDGSGTVMTAPGLLDEAGLRALVTSPGKKKLKKLLSDTGNYCVLVFVPGGEEKADAAALATVSAALVAHRKEYPAQVMPILRVDRKDPAEAFFLSELGATPAPAPVAGGAKPKLSVRAKPAEDNDGNAPTFAIVFGKGRVLHAPFEGEGLTKETLAEAFDYLNGNASDCGDDAVFVSEDTSDLLMHWEPAVENKMLIALEEAGVELYNPWSEVEFDASGQPIAHDAETAAPAVPAAPALSAPPAAAKSPLPTSLLPALGGVILVVVLGGWLILRKRAPV